MFSVDQSLVLVGKLSATTNMSKFTQRSRKGPADQKERTRQRTVYMHESQQVCRETFFVHPLVSLVK